MGAPRLRIGLVVATAAAVIGGMVVPTAAVAAAAPPTGLTPDTYSTHVKNVVLSWSPVAGASTYRVQVSDRWGLFDNEDPGSTEKTEPSIDETTTLTTYAPSAKLPHGLYRWRVSADGGAWSAPARFNRDWDGAPGNARVYGDDAGHTSTTGPGPVLTWDALRDASYYEIQYSARPFAPGTTPVDGGDGSGEGDEAIQSCLTTNTVFTPYTATKGKDEGITEGTNVKCLEVADGATIHWRVRGRDGVLGSEPVKIERPTEECTGINYNEGTAGAVGTLGDDCSDWGYPASPTFTVAKTAGVSKNGMGATAAAGDETPQNAVLWPQSSTGTAGTKDDPKVVTTTPAFDWSPVAGASFYRVTTSPDDKTSGQYHEWETTATSLAPVLLESDNTTPVSWQVQACTVNALDPDGFALTYAASEERFAQCAAPTALQWFVKTTPTTVSAGTATKVTGGYQLTWNSAIDATKPNGSLAARVPDVKGYKLQTSDFYGSFTGAGARTYKVDRQVAASTGAEQSRAAIPSSALPSGFKWRVRGVDSANNEGPWSNVQTVGTLASATGKLVTGSNFALNAGLTFQFNADVDGVTATSARIVAASTGAAVSGTVTQTSDARTFQFKPAAGVRYVPGEQYRLQLTTAVQTVGTNVAATANSATIRAARDVDSADASIKRYSGDYGWATLRAGNAYKGSYLLTNDKRTTAKRSQLQLRARGTAVTVYACFGPRSGYARIAVNGSVKKTLSLYRASSSCGKLATIPLSSGSQQTIAFLPTGTKVAKSKSTEVRFDRFVIS